MQRSSFPGVRGRWTIPLTLLLAGAGALILARGFLYRDGRGSTGWTPSLGLVSAKGCDLACVADSETQAVVSDLVRASRSAPALPAVTIDYPLDGTVFPPDLAPPTLLWHDAAGTADLWLVVIVLDAGAVRLCVLTDGTRLPGKTDPRLLGAGKPVYEPTAYQLSARSWKPDEAVWSLIKRKSVDARARITLLGFSRTNTSRPVSSGELTCTTSTDPVGAPIFYRDVPLLPTTGEDGTIKPLPASMLPLVEWRLRDVSKPSSRLLLTNLHTCANCHSFSLDGKTMGMDVDGPSGDKGTYTLTPVETNTVIRADDIITWNSFDGRRPDRNTIGFLSRISPDGRYAVSTVNEELYVMNYMDYRFLQVFYPLAGVLAWYSRETGEFRALPGADDPRYVHCNAVWSPDGKWIVFARAKALKNYPARRRPTHANDEAEIPMLYDLYRLPFNAGSGGKATPIKGACGDGMSHSFPKVSPDGKWIVFVSCRNGQLMRPDSRLWIVPFEGGKARGMRCNTTLMNSWHSFSPNSRWLVFSSKQNTPFTQMFLTHIDEHGNDTPAVLIENATLANRAVNIPEFVNVSYDGFQRISAPTLAYYEHFLRGRDLADHGQLEAATAALKKALRNDPDDSRILNDLGIVFGRMGKHEEAQRSFRHAIRSNPGKAAYHENLGHALMLEKRYAEAKAAYDTALRLTPTATAAWCSRGWVRQMMGDTAGALSDYARAITLSPNSPAAYVQRAQLLARMNRIEEALADADKAVELDPISPSVWYVRGLVRQRKGDRSGARQDLRKYLDTAPTDDPRRESVQRLLQ